jgi:hypothetical protein
MQTIRSTNLPYKRHRKLVLINNHPPPFLLKPLRHSVPVCSLSIGAAFFMVLHGSWWEWGIGEPDFTGEAGRGMGVDDVEAFCEVSEVFVCGHVVGG